MSKIIIEKRSTWLERFYYVRFFSLREGALQLLEKSVLHCKLIPLICLDSWLCRRIYLNHSVVHF
ncbi:hypothetical protein VCHENC02_1782 [Vibrio harveyi]|uniref:Uncharacterized protein n=1 Tax=Vibrio harveyi TaxID=669 RepID=A0A454D249_VIBHA|nr:hypothetical protein VCHENC02_1782 [Vibrio harveyi]